MADWQPGDLAECINGGGWELAFGAKEDLPKGARAPAQGHVARVLGVSGQSHDPYLALAGFHEKLVFRANMFLKVQPVSELVPCTAEFARQLRDLIATRRAEDEGRERG